MTAEKARGGVSNPETVSPSVVPYSRRSTFRSAGNSFTQSSAIAICCLLWRRPLRHPNPLGP